MNQELRISKLENLHKQLTIELEEKNQNRLYLAWGFTSALLATSGLEIVKELFPKSYLITLISLFLFGLALTYLYGKVIESKINNKSNLLKEITKEIEFLKRN